jgi:hypothetical protein
MKLAPFGNGSIGLSSHWFAVRRIVVDSRWARQSGSGIRRGFQDALTAPASCYAGKMQNGAKYAKLALLARDEETEP